MPHIETVIIELFLRSQPGVIDAWVGYEGQRLVAEVTIQEGSGVSGRSLQVACKQHLGLQYTPSAVVLIQSRPKAA